MRLLIPQMRLPINRLATKLKVLENLNSHEILLALLQLTKKQESNNEINIKQ